MKFKLGDFVRFIDEKREGYVTRIIDAQTLGVTDQDGFEIPVVAGNLTHVHGHGKAAELEDEAPKPIAVNVSAVKSIDKGIYLAIAADDKAGNVVHFFLQNHTAKTLLVALNTNRKEKFAGVYHGILKADQSELVYAASLADLAIWPEFLFQFLIFSDGDEKPIKPLLLDKKFRAKDFSMATKDLPQLKQKGWLIRLDEEQLQIDAEKLKESFFKPHEAEKKIDIPEREVDLHIEKIRNDHHFLTAEEILTAQINHFEKAMDAAIVHRFEAIVFIHGAGNGTLRHKIHKLISQNAHVKTYMDARKEKFGYGATEVVFKNSN